MHIMKQWWTRKAGTSYYYNRYFPTGGVRGAKITGVFWNHLMSVNCWVVNKGLY